MFQFEDNRRRPLSGRVNAAEGRALLHLWMLRGSVDARGAHPDDEIERLLQPLDIRAALARYVERGSARAGRDRYRQSAKERDASIEMTSASSAAIESIISLNSQ